MRILSSDRNDLECFTDPPYVCNILYYVYIVTFRATFYQLRIMLYYLYVTTKLLLFSLLLLLSLLYPATFSCYYLVFNRNGSFDDCDSDSI